jgi:hypothetical protein
MYAMEAGVTWYIPWMCAFPDLVALCSELVTELGDVKMDLNAFARPSVSYTLEYARKLQTVL